MNPSRTIRLAVAFAFALAAACPAATTQPTELPVKSVTLYTSGVGFFQHDGRVTGDGVVTLKFKTGQINDVIKSLVVQDDGGRVTGVQYPSQDPLDKTLKTFQIDLTDNPSMAALLGQLRGAKVTIEHAGAKDTGTVVGVEVQKKTDADKTVAESAVLNLLSDGTLSYVELNQVRSIRLEDPALAAELSQALAAVAAGRDQDKKPVTVRFAGGGEHLLHVGYVVETPVWKVAYRLLLNDKAAATPATTKPADGYLQGWAVVENQTDSDWNDVSLRLVSGRPISFVMDLYQPTYVTRPVVELNLFQGLKPQVYYGAQPMRRQVAMEDKMGGGRAGGGMVANVAVGAAAPAAPLQQLFSGDTDSDIQSAALTVKLGTLFQYAIEHVSLPRQQSSLVPIVTDRVQAEPLSIYNETVLPRNPLTGVMLTNSTGKLLPQGPITVLSGGAYAGDAQIEDLPAGQKRLLSFGVDLETSVQVTNGIQNDIVSGKIVNGALQLSRRLSQTKSYAIENQGDTERTVIVEHPVISDWPLVGTPDPIEKTDTRYRFRVPVAKGKTETLKVTQQSTTNEIVAMLNSDLNGLIFNSRNGALPAKVRDALAEVIRRRQAFANLDRQANEKQAAIDAVAPEQQRIRDNMKAVDKNGPYYARLLAKLNDQETDIETLQKEKDDLLEKAKQARADLEAYLSTLSVG